jgi:hypothetical protein
MPDILVTLGWVLTPLEIICGFMSLALAPGWQESGCSHPIWKAIFDQRLKRVILGLEIITLYIGEHISLRMQRDKISSVR